MNANRNPSWRKGLRAHLLVASVGAMGCAASLQGGAGRPLTLRDRSIPFAQVAAGFPYWRVIPDYPSGRLFAFRDAAGARTLESWALPEGTARLDESGRTRLDRGADWRGRNYWGMEFDRSRRAMIVWADARGDEANELYAVPLDGGASTALTDVASVMGFGVDSAGRIAYLARRAGKAPFTTCLRVREGGGDREVVCDDPSLRFGVAMLTPLPSAGNWLVPMRGEGNRNRATLARVDVAAKKITPLLAPFRRAVANPLAPLPGADGVLYLSDESGTTQLWRLAGGAASRLTALDREVASAVVLKPGARTLVALLLAGPQSTALELVSPDDGRVVWSDSIPGNAEILDATADRFYLVRDSQADPVSLEEWILRDDGAHLSREIEPRLAPSPAERAEMVQCDAAAVEIPTFDEDPATHAPRTISAWLLTPKHPAPERERFALVRGFYGGENVFDTEAQLACAAGGASLSPAIRGSSGFGAAYAALNDGDMGGDEVYDLFRAGAWLSRRLNLPAARVGIWGGSHGGYEVLRALTFPEGVNGRHEPRFEFGFGIAHSAIADLPALAGTTRIPDWLAREAGTDPAHLRERSPIEHLDLLRAPILLTAGREDTRVPIAQSRAFVERARAKGKDVTLVELTGQGHHVEGIDAEREIWAARIAFLDRVLPR